jgi:hypothetical protein
MRNTMPDWTKVADFFPEGNVPSAQNRDFRNKLSAT